MKQLGFTAAAILGSLIIFGLMTTDTPRSDPVKGQAPEDWMAKDETLPDPRPSRLLALTDLPALDPALTPEDFIEAKNKSRLAGCNAAVLSFSWPALEPESGKLTLDELKAGITLSTGQFLFLGIQILNTTIKELPADLTGKRFDDPQVMARFQSFLDSLAPLLRHRVHYLSIGNESDIYLSAHPDEIREFAVFLNAAHSHLEKIAPDLIVSTTLTDAGALKPEFQQLIMNMDAHFLTYYHGQHGPAGQFKDTAKTKDAIMTLIGNLDSRPVVFQEIGFPAHPELGSPEHQAEFVTGVFDAWDELGSRIPLLNYYMMYDFPKAFVQEQISYYSIPGYTEPLIKFMSTLGLHKAEGTPRPGWEVFQRRGRKIKQDI